MGGELDHVEIGAGSWRDVTRVAGVDPGLWTQIFIGNRDELSRVIEEFEGSLGSLRSLIEDGDASALKRILETARVAKAEQIAKMPEPEPANGIRPRRKR